MAAWDALTPRHRTPRSRAVGFEVRYRQTDPLPLVTPAGYRDPQRFLITITWVVSTPANTETPRSPGGVRTDLQTVPMETSIARRGCPVSSPAEVGPLARRFDDDDPA